MKPLKRSLLTSLLVPGISATVYAKMSTLLLNSGLKTLLSKLGRLAAILVTLSTLPSKSEGRRLRFAQLILPCIDSVLAPCLHFSNLKNWFYPRDSPGCLYSPGRALLYPLFLLALLSKEPFCHGICSDKCDNVLLSAG